MEPISEMVRISDSRPISSFPVVDGMFRPLDVFCLSVDMLLYIQTRGCQYLECCCADRCGGQATLQVYRRGRQSVLHAASSFTS